MSGTLQNKNLCYDNFMIIAVLVVLGLCFGSFVSALTWRLRQQDTRKKLTKKQRRELSMVHGRSMCSHCGHELGWYDLLPVVSWVLLRGKCRYCGQKIEDSPLVEVGTASLFVVSYLAWPYELTVQGSTLYVFWLVFLVAFVALIVYDLKWMELPNKIVYSLIGLVVVQVVFRMITEGDAWGVAAESFWGFLAIGGLFYALFQISDGRWIGGGDVKLGFVIGPLVGGPLASLSVIFLASVLGTMFSLPLMAKKSLQKTSRIPFGPFLVIATMVVYLYGDRLIDFYQSLIL